MKSINIYMASSQRREDYSFDGMETLQFGKTLTGEPSLEFHIICGTNGGKPSSGTFRENEARLRAIGKFLLKTEGSAVKTIDCYGIWVPATREIEIHCWRQWMSHNHNWLLSPDYRFRV